ncbi:MAG TPA: gluconokinase [Oligoflexia bacterium]|nr:gluconokinase [Oligoflexia bacterium]HMP49468.1 gluconokinase [Oligoflexia bacterium]
MRHIKDREEQAAITAIVVMGVSGSGKSTIGEKLAVRLGWRFFDGDDFHPEENKVKQSKGIPLNDDDRLPWLKNLSRLVASSENEGSLILACSALRRFYREIIVGSLPSVMFVYLQGTQELIGERLAERKGHFMNPALLPAQFATLEEPSEEEAVHIDISPSPDEIVESIVINMKAGVSVEIS